MLAIVKLAIVASLVALGASTCQKPFDTIQPPVVHHLKGHCGPAGAACYTASSSWQ